MTAPSSVTLEIEGMTCAACVSRIERKLNKRKRDRCDEDGESS